MNGTVVVSCRSPEEVQRAAREPARLVVLRARPAQSVPAAPTTFTQVTPTGDTLSRGTTFLTKHTKNEYYRLQDEAASLRSELGALRAAAEGAERTKEGLRSDNTRLTHRISYLEEQVADLLDRHHHLRPTASADGCITVNKSRKNVTHINIGAEPAASGRTSRSEVQVFQKGPDITAIVAKLPGLDASDANLPLMRPRSNASGASSRASPPPAPAPALHSPRAHSSHAEHRAARLRPALSHHCIHAADYGTETDAAIRMIERNQRHMEKQRLRERLARSHDYLDLLPSASPSPSPAPAPAPAPARDSKHYEIEKAADRIEESIKKTNWAERKTLSIIEQLKRSQRLRKLRRSESGGDETPVEPAAGAGAGSAELARRIDGKVLENAHKSSRRSSKLHSRSARSSEFESECSDFPGGEGGGGGSRPTPPRKPLRLSLHRARSAHDLQPEELGGLKRPVKRSHATERGLRERANATPRPPRKLLDAHPADRLYPETQHPHPHFATATATAGNWC